MPPLLPVCPRLACRLGRNTRLSLSRWSPCAALEAAGCAGHQVSTWPGLGAQRQPCHCPARFWEPRPHPTCCSATHRAGLSAQRRRRAHSLPQHPAGAQRSVGPEGWACPLCHRAHCASCWPWGLAGRAVARHWLGAGISTDPGTGRRDMGAVGAEPGGTVPRCSGCRGPGRTHTLSRPLPGRAVSVATRASAAPPPLCSFFENSGFVGNSMRTGGVVGTGVPASDARPRPALSMPSMGSRQVLGLWPLKSLLSIS